MLGQEDILADTAQIPEIITLRGTEGPLKVRLAAPAKWLCKRLRLALRSADQDLVAAAALFYCSVAVRSHVRRSAQIERLGEEVLRWADEAGVPESQIDAAGTFALALCTKDLDAIDWEAVNTLADFTGPKREEPIE